uniref:Reverse transcriptase domain-containing protein n=1 Tax=Tanacetum cinerariifolium TaxID=118510 RepID=A0A6L2K988_TANCI|nr:reverse transcriptase domain-containing protein [Tanacetum cinerariifolium]
MRTRSSSNLPVVSPPNPSTSNPKCRNRRRSKQPFILEEYPIDTMADQRTMAKLLRAPTEGAARWWLEKEPPRSILTWEDLISKFIIEFFPPSRTTNLRNEISNFQQRFDESFHEAWDRYKDLLRACPHRGFTELHQLDTFYNALNPADQDSLNAAAGFNLLERHTQDVLAIIENKSKVRNSRNKSVVSQVKSSDANSNSSSKIAKLTHAANQDNIQGYVAAAAINYNQGNSVYRPPGMANQIRPPGFAQPNVQNNQNRFSQPQGYNRGNNFNPEQSYQASTQQNQVVPLRSGSLPSNTIANPKGKLKAITTQSGIVLDGPSVHIPPRFINPEKDERVDETLTDQDLAEYTIKKKLGLPELISTCMSLELANQAICTPAGITRDVYVPVDNFTFPADYVIVDYESYPRVPLILGRPFLRTARALIDVHREEMILRDGDKRLTLNIRHDTSSYSNQPQKESINLINVFNDSNEDFLKDLFSTNQLSSNPTFSSHPELPLPEVKNDIFDPEGGNFLPEKLLDLNTTKYLHPPLHVNPLSGSTTYSSSPNQLLEELALITFPPGNDDLQFDIESDLKKIEYLLHYDPIKDIDSILKDSIDQSNLADLNNNLVDSMPEMFTDEHAHDYSSPPLYDEYDDDLFKVESDTENVYDDPFDSNGEKIKEFTLLIDELDLPYDFLLPSEYDSFLFEDFSKVDALPSAKNEDKVFNPCILIQENLFEIITRVAQDKKLAISHASLMIEDFNPPLYELLFFKEVPRSKMLLLFLSENKEKVFKPGIHTFEKVHSSLITELSHQGYKIFKINQVLKSPMNNFLFSCGKDTHILDVPCHHFYPLGQFKYGGIGSS